MTEKFDIIHFLKSAIATGASDEHLQVGQPPYIRKNGFIKRINMPVLSIEDINDAVLQLSPQNLKDSILNRYDKDFMYEIPGFSRFRVNFNKQLGEPALVIRNIPYKVPVLESLNLPDIITKLTNCNSGIILLTGPTGCGKSTTLASLIQAIAQNSSKHIITVEDPIEYIFTSSKSLVSQRQVGVDTTTYLDGIKYALRQDPDVILIGEIRDKATMDAALKAAETGHLVFSTLHTNDAVQTINRIINLFDEDSRNLARKQLAETLRATISQKLIYSEKEEKRFPACEVMVTTPAIRDYILKDNIDAIYELLKDNSYDNMVSLNVSLAILVNAGLITEEEALKNSNDVNELERIFKGAFKGTKAYYE